MQYRGPAVGHIDATSVGADSNAYSRVGADAVSRWSSTALPAGLDGNTSFNWPAFSPGGLWVYYTLIQGKQGSEIDRISIGGGTPEKVVENACQAVLSPDGRRIGFLRFDADRFTSSLWLADGDGRNPRPLVNENVFAGLAAPRFSPDGQAILFSASGPPRYPVRAVNACQPALLCAFAEPVYADGLPWDLWEIGVDGSVARQFDQSWGRQPVERVVTQRSLCHLYGYNRNVSAGRS